MSALDKDGFVRFEADETKAMIGAEDWDGFAASWNDLPLDGFKGYKLGFRPWDGQLRQPIPLVQPRALVSTSPQEGFLHPASELDSLGLDAPESQCRLADAPPQPE